MDLREVVMYVSAACVCALMVWLIPRKRSEQQSNDLHLLPRPPGWRPIIGHLHILQRPLHRYLRELAQKHGPLFYLQLGSVNTLVASSPHWAKEFLQAQDRHLLDRPLYEASKRIMYNNTSLTMIPHGPVWRHLRKLYASELLTPKRFESFQKARLDEMALVMKTVRSRAMQGGTLNVRRLVFSALCNMLTMMMFSKRVFDLNEALDGKGNKFKDLVEESSILYGTPAIGDVIPWLTWLDTSLKRKMDRVHKGIDAFMEDVIVERVESKKAVKDEETSDYLDVLLRLYSEDGKLDKDSIKVTLLDILIGGSETTGSTIEWAMAELVNNQACLKKLQEELDTVAGGRGSEEDKCLGDKQLEKLSYLQAVVKENFRMHPAVPINVRLFPENLDQDILQVGDYRVPKKTRVLLNIWALNRDPHSWGPDSNTFDPERFLVNSPPDVRGQNFEFMTFGSGRRGCPGMNITLVLVPFVVANLVQSMNWDTPNGAPPDLSDHSAFTAPMATPLVAKASPRTSN